jgi:hypothetical protein
MLLSHNLTFHSSKQHNATSHTPRSTSILQRLAHLALTQDCTLSPLLPAASNTAGWRTWCVPLAPRW